jgi:hypothetical protein
MVIKTLVDVVMVRPGTSHTRLPDVARNDVYTNLRVPFVFSSYSLSTLFFAKRIEHKGITSRRVRMFGLQNCQTDFNSTED